MIVVTAPTGNIGHVVVQRLLEAGENVRVIVRDPVKLPQDAHGRVEIVEGSHGDAAVVDRAFSGADALFWLAPPDFTQTLDEAYVGFTRPLRKRSGARAFAASSASPRSVAERSGRLRPAM